MGLLTKLLLHATLPIHSSGEDRLNHGAHPDGILDNPSHPSGGMPTSTSAEALASAHAYLTSCGRINFGAALPPPVEAAPAGDAAVLAPATVAVAPPPPSMKMIKARLYAILMTVDFLVGGGFKGLGF